MIFDIEYDCRRFLLNQWRAMNKFEAGKMSANSAISNKNQFFSILAQGNTRIR